MGATAISGLKMRNFVVIPRENQYRLKLDMNGWAKGICLAEIRSSKETRVVKIVKN